MKMLMAALHPPGSRLSIGGVQTWITTTSEVLRTKNHDIKIWGPEWRLPDDKYDVGVFASWTATKQAGSLCRKVLKISHGVVPTEKEADAYTSEEVRSFWKGDGPIIRQPIDINFWHPQNYQKEYLTRFSYRSGLTFLPLLAKKYNLKYVHLKSESPENCRNILQRSAVVIATGRAAVEAMACGAPVVIADAREYQGELLDFDTLGSMHRNYSGRGGIKPDSASMDKAIAESIERGNLRHHVVQNHDSLKVTDQLLDMINRL